MIISQLIGADINRDAFYLFGIKHEKFWNFNKFKNQYVGRPDSFTNFRLELIKS